MSQHTSSGGDLLLRLYLPPIPFLLLGDAYHSRGNLKVFPNFQSTSKDRCVCTAARWQTAALLHYCDKAFVCICQLPTLRGPQNVACRLFVLSSPSSKLSRAWRAEHPHANIDRTWASNSSVNPSLKLGCLILHLSRLLLSSFNCNIGL